MQSGIPAWGVTREGSAKIVSALASGGFQPTCAGIGSFKGEREQRSSCGKSELPEWDCLRSDRWGGGGTGGRPEVVHAFPSQSISKSGTSPFHTFSLSWQKQTLNHNKQSKGR